MKLINSDKYCIKMASEMDDEELCNWFAFMNAVKFINSYCNKKHIDANSVDLDSREIEKYIRTTSGDILTNLREQGAIPLKYSLDASHEESKNIEEINYEGLTNGRCSVTIR
jgi:hypothetical protein